MSKYHYHCVNMEFGNERWRVFFNTKKVDPADGAEWDDYWPMADCHCESDAKKIVDALNAQESNHEQGGTG